jgi:hypothetical protein
MDILAHVLSGKVTHTGTKHIWLGQIKIPILEFVSLLANFLKREHHDFLGRDVIVIEGFSVLRARGGQWWGPKSMTVFVKDALNDPVISENSEYGRRLALDLKRKIIKDLGHITIEITVESVMNDLNHLNVTLKDGSAPEYVEFNFEIDLQANPI